MTESHSQHLALLTDSRLAESKTRLYRKDIGQELMTTLEGHQDEH